MHYGLRLRAERNATPHFGATQRRAVRKKNIGHILYSVSGGVFFRKTAADPERGVFPWSREITRAAESMIPVLSFQSDPGPAKNINEKKPRAPAYISTNNMPSFPQIRLYPDVSTSSQPSRMCDSVGAPPSSHWNSGFFFFGVWFAWPA